MGGIRTSNLFQTGVFSKSYNEKCAKVFSSNFDLPVICTSVLLNYIVDLVTLDCMLLIMVYLSYRYVFVVGAAAFDRVGELSEFAL